jgi:hypothetical protein
MNTLVLSLMFFAGLGLFAIWLFWTLRSERVRAQALREQARRNALASRRATRAARRESTLPIETIPVVRAGSFCRVPGSYARNTHGAVLVCANERKGRPRWRHADQLSRAS